MKFNKSQEEAILHKDGPCMVLAGPGSGKTAVITQRTYNLIKNQGVDPGHILVITFSKAAAREMKERFLLLSQEGKSRVTFGTFHAVFFMVLKAAYHFEAGNVISEEAKYQLMRQLVAQHHLEYRDENEFIGNLLGEISRVKNERIPLEYFYSAQCGESVFRDIYREYDKQLKGSRLIDFDDMLVYTYELFAQRPDILQLWQKKYQYILIDEYQDINQLQFDIIKLLAQPANNLFVVGDDDQSIYRFRGSKPELMLKFPEYYPNTKKILLDVNYRCDAQVVEAAKRLISHNKTRYEKAIQASRPGQNPVVYQRLKTLKEETDYTIGLIRKGVEEGQHYRDFAVLFRTNTQPRFLTEQLLAYNIPFKTKDHLPNLYEHWIAKDLRTYLRIAAGSRERADFLGIMNRPLRYIGRDSLTDATVAFDVWMEYYKEQPWVADRIERLWYDIRMLGKMSPYAALNYIRNGIGYEEYLRSYAQQRNIEVKELLDVYEELMMTAKGYNSYGAWETHMLEYSVQMQQLHKQENQNPDAVMLSTLHGSKGLEYDTVIIVDANEGVMPYKKAVLDQDIEEERRLFYVGMTRAKNKLFILSLGSQKDKQLEVSRFIEEAQKD